MKTLVLYYSKTGNNRYLAERLALDLKADCEAIVPRLDKLGLILLGLSLGNRSLKHRPNDYQRLILCGPIWMGKLLAPLKNVIRQLQSSQVPLLYFISCCGSGEQQKDGKFGYNPVFAEVRALLGSRCQGCQAFSVEHLLSDEQKNNNEASMAVRLSDDNFHGPIAKLYHDYVQRLQA